MQDYQYPKQVDLRYKLERPDRMEILPGFAFNMCARRYGVIKPFWSDGASIPQAVRSLIGDRFAEAYMIAALVHDILYAIQYATREEADRALYDIMRKCGVGRVKAWSIYRAVRMFGWAAWNAKTDEMIEGARKHIEIIELIGVPVC